MTSMFAAGNASTLGAAAQTQGNAGSGFGKAFMIVQALSALSTVAGGLAGSKASSNEAELLDRQSELMLSEARRDARIKRGEASTFKESQQQQYSSRGVLVSEGSPMEVLSDTLRKGEEEATAIMQRGQAMADLNRMRAAMTRSSGKYGMLSGLLGAGAGIGSAIILGKRLGFFGSNSGAIQPSPQPIPSNLPPAYGDRLR